MFENIMWKFSKIYREMHKCVDVIDAIENDIAINNNECER